MEYVFYFDESFHDRKIVISDDGKINTMRPDAIDDYVGVFWGCKRAKLDKYIKELATFEDNYRSIFGLPAGKEFKSETIRQKNYQYGIRSFNKNTMDFYFDLFRVLEHWEFILQINIVSKIEILIRHALRSIEFPSFANRNSFIYSLTKLIVVHRPKQLLEALEAVANGGSPLGFRDTLLDTLRAMIIASEGVPRKEKTIEAFTEMCYVLESMSFDVTPVAKTDFLYFVNFDGLCRLLDEISIRPQNIKITIDVEENTFKAAQDYQFGRVKQGKSDSSIQLRLSDFLSGFIGRMIYAMTHDESTRELALEDITAIDLEDIKEKRLLNSKWFELTERHFDLYKLVYKVLIEQHSHYWTTLTLAYNDNTICFFALLRYIASYPSYHDFIAVSPNLHSEYFNARAVEEIAEYYLSL